jgi:hypothetical protein
MLEDQGHAKLLQAGDLCRTGLNRLPTFRVIHVVDDKAWLRDVNGGPDTTIPLTSCFSLRDQDEVARMSPEAFADAGVTEPTGPLWPNGTARP